ncbi:hypothetical protein KOI35_37850 [Actinoplanes bogorensis]|uniref:Uncharacterized protein n=1 Tax=Paractinoplanes bogorensis TaxID=1610840 RepID=A0ABS5Z0T3_9ACTN|nr:hypothetical protein [Actinoplanes bogorensis]MBU2669292.1 hypothetical protein [Actinoplanes bogorensis]
MNPGAERAESVEDLVREHLGDGERFLAAVWVSRADAQTLAGMTKSDLSPWRFRRPKTIGPATRRGVHGTPRSLAYRLDEHIRNVTEPRLLAVTDRRLVLLAKGLGSWRELFRPRTGAASLRWEAPRAQLAKAGDNDGRLRLDFGDGSAVSLLTPATGLRSFLDAF